MAIEVDVMDDGEKLYGVEIDGYTIWFDAPDLERFAMLLDDVEARSTAATLREAMEGHHA